MAQRWYTLQTRPLCEYAARRDLEARDVEAFLPCARTANPRPGQETVPLFPGYLFVHYDLESQGSSVLTRAPSVAGLVSFGGVVPDVPDLIMDELMQRVEEINKAGGVWARFSAGDLVKVLIGPSESLGQVIEDTRSPGAPVRVLLEFLGHLVEARVPKENLEPVGKLRQLEVVGRRAPRRTRGRRRWIHGFGMRQAATA